MVLEFFKDIGFGNLDVSMLSVAKMCSVLFSVFLLVFGSLIIKRLWRIFLTALIALCFILFVKGGLPL
jgi:hypothetical protein